MPTTLRLWSFAARLRILWIAAWLWRRLLVRTRFIAITGSVGKTTAKECLAAALSTRFRVAKSLRNQNDRYGLPRTILRIRPWQQVAVVEVATGGPGDMRPLARLVRPDIGIVLTVARTHTGRFAALEETAADKAELVKALPFSGLAILNGDDLLVRAMAGVCRGRVVTFGRGTDCDVVGREAPSTWPSRLALEVEGSGWRTRVRTQLVGSHWFNSVMATVAAAAACGADPAKASQALEHVVPFPGRMQPVLLPCGAVMLRDEAGNTAPTVEAALQVLAGAVASRRVLVTDTPTDSHESSRQRFRELARRTARIADLAVFISREHGVAAVNAALGAGMPRGAARACGDLREAAAFLRSELRSGDLVLLKGRTTEHLSRLVFAQFGEVGCWKNNCRKLILCDFCPELGAAQKSLPMPPVHVSPTEVFLPG